MNRIDVPEKPTQPSPESPTTDDASLGRRARPGAASEQDPSAPPEHEERARVSAAEARQALGSITALAYDHAPVGLCFFDPERRYVLVNRQLAAWHGCSIEAHLGRTMREVLPERHRFLEPLLQRVIDTRQELCGHEVVLANAEGTQSVWCIDYRPVIEDERLLGVSAVIRDISDRHASEGALRASLARAERVNQTRTLFLNDLSHKLRTPLTAIIGFSSLLVRQVQGAAARHARLISDNSRQLLETIDAVFTLARIEGGKLDLSTQPLQLAEAIAALLAPHAEEARERGISLRLRVHPAAREATAPVDREALKTITHSLLSNALKFTDEGQVTVSLDADDAHVTLAVRDTGAGMTEAFQATAFDHFTREARTNRQRQGAGLGLTIARRLIEATDGSLTLRSAPDEGSLFSIRWPRCDAASAAAGVARRRRRGLRGARVLAIEDDHPIRALLDALLGRWGCVTQAVASSRRALELIEDSTTEYAAHIDLVLLDIHLGDGLDGRQLLRVMRYDARWQMIPVIALTAHTMPGDRQMLLAEGFDGYLAKPFTPDELRAALAQQLE